MDNGGCNVAAASDPKPRRGTVNTQASSKFKRDILPDILLHDGFVCLYCEISLVGRNWNYEHLDDDPTNNVRENIGLSCQSCNNKKPYSSTMKQIALRKKQKMKRGTIRAGEC